MPKLWKNHKYVPESEAEAKKMARHEYMPDKPCSRGHFSMRRVGSGRCITCEQLRFYDNVK